MYDPEEIREKLELGDIPVEFKASSNISPGQDVPVVLDPVKRDVRLFRWGLVPGWAKDPAIGYKMFNARSETITEKPSFRVAFRRRRCLIPADGFYEWSLEGSRKFPYLFSLKNREPFTFAGLWDAWRDAEGNELKSCTIITTEPNSLLAQYHNRMPVIMDKSICWKWLESNSEDVLKTMMVPYSVEKMTDPVRMDRL